MGSCPICTNNYGGNVVPTILACCSGHACYRCCEKDRVAKISKPAYYNKMIECMFCIKRFHCFNETPWIVNIPFIGVTGIEVDMSDVRQAQGSIEYMRQEQAARENISGRNTGIRVLTGQLSQEIVNEVRLHYGGPWNDSNEPYEITTEDSERVLSMAIFCDEKYYNYMYNDLLDTAITYAYLLEFCDGRFNLDAISAIVEEAGINVKEEYSRENDVHYQSELNEVLTPDIEERLSRYGYTNTMNNQTNN